LAEIAPLVAVMFWRGVVASDPHTFDRGGDCSPHRTQSAPTYVSSWNFVTKTARQ